MSKDTNVVEAIFLQALERPRDETLAFLDEQCGADGELKQQVLELLSAHEQTGSFFVDHRPGWSVPAKPTMVEDIVGERIGPYTVREKIGEGGMGVVYVADQEKPLRRKVALKVIKPGMDSNTVLGRFEAERNALALMNHPHIAKVLDAGTTREGRPYFVMELVNGIPVTQYCDDQKLPIGDRLALFRDVCGAIQHAHQKGIIHRDIKPSNVLVTELDGKPIAKVIDFGVAKALNQSLAEHTLYTAFQTVIGTPLYMSPEQASFSAVDVDTRSDVYSLGVLLYELLTGTTPFSENDLKHAAQDEVFKFIRDVEPPRPSNRISSLGNTATRISQLRCTHPEQLNRTVKGDLDWIVMKAISKERGRRYKTADALSEDIDRHLNNHPVEARPPSMSYRLSRFYRRNSVAVTASCVVVAVTLGLTTLAASSLVRETKLAARYREELADKVMMRVLSGAPRSEDDVQEAIDAGVDDAQIRLLRAIQTLYSGTPEHAIELLKPVARDHPHAIPANAVLAMAYYYTGQLWDGILQRDKATSLQPQSPIDLLFLALCTLGVEQDGIQTVDSYLDEQKTPLGFAVRANVTAWSVGYRNAGVDTIPEALDDLRTAQRFLGQTAYVLQTQLRLNMEAYRFATFLNNDGSRFLADAKAAESNLAKNFPDYVWGKSMRGAFWYGLHDYKRAVAAWSGTSNDFILGNRGLALVKAGKVRQAQAVVEQIASPHFRLVVFPALLHDERGQELAQAAFEDVVKLAENNMTYRDPFVLIVGVLVGLPYDEVHGIATRWLKTWESDRDLAWVTWNRKCLEYLIDELTRDELFAIAGDHGGLNMSAHFYSGARELMSGNRDAAFHEFSKGYDKDWGLTFYGAMWCECLVDMLGDERGDGQRESATGEPRPNTDGRLEPLTDG